MTYGVDQCRMCGTRISPKGPEAAADQEKANRHCLMPEKEWRRRGFLAPPTKFQIHTNPSDGCCPKCGMRMLRKHSKFGVMTFTFAGVFIVVAVVFCFVITYLPH